jgi:restriction system protein
MEKVNESEYDDGIPSWEWFLRPVLEVLKDGKTQTRRDLENSVLDLTGVTSEQRQVEHKSGGYKANGRVGWSLTALKRARALGQPGRGLYAISDAGLKLLADYQTAITEKDLMKLPAWGEHVPATTKRVSTDTSSSLLQETDPVELIELGLLQVNSNVAGDLLAKLREGHPEFFERAVVQLLIAMGYGGSEKRVQHLGQSNDGGVDGVIDQDALGLNRVFVQAKRYAQGNNVQRPDLQKFVGALADKGATQGVFVTTSTFSEGAIDYVERIPNRVVLIDGSRLTELMIQYKVGVQIQKSFELVEMDEDFFD